MAVEEIKQNSQGLRGPLPLELVEASPQFSEEGKQLLKFHGIYQQTNRDMRGHNNKQHSFMVRSKLPGGRLTAEQYLVHDALADEFGQGDLRLTTRQAIQLHGVIKGNLLREQVQRRYPIQLEVRKSGLTPELQALAYQPQLWRVNPDLCCHMRKVVPLTEALVGLSAWLTGLRRDQGASRGTVPLISWDAKYNPVKLNPLANWTRGQV